MHSGWVIALLCMLATASPAQAAEPKERLTVWGEDLEKYLRDFDEVLLSKGTSRGDAYRLTIDHSHSFRKTIIRLERRSETRWRLTTKHKYRDQWRTWTRSLKTSDIQSVLQLLNHPEFWAMEGNLELIDKEAKNDGTLTSICLHPPYFVIEARLNGQNHGAGLYVCGSDDLFVPAGYRLIELVGKDMGYLN
jgi:hypothetical protein